MFIFDTSGSMRDNNSGNQVADGDKHLRLRRHGSRIYSLKSGIRAALAQVGTDEANFGLMSLPRRRW